MGISWDHDRSANRHPAPGNLPLGQPGDSGEALRVTARDNAEPEAPEIRKLVDEGLFS